MPVVKSRSVLSGMLVKEAMRRQMLQLYEKASVSQAIQYLIKFKVNALLVVGYMGSPLGVVSKTDIVAAFYGGLPLETSLKEVMNGPAATCFPDEPLEAALERMHKAGIHQLYLQGAEEGSLKGALSYEDAVAVLYRFCRACPRRVGAGKASEASWDASMRLRVEEARTRSVVFCRETDSLAEVAEGLTSQRLGAVLIQGRDGEAAGVVSKTDLLIAYATAPSSRRKPGLS